MNEEYDDLVVLEEIRAKKGRKTFESIINSPKASKFEMDDCMAEA